MKIIQVIPFLGMGGAETMCENLVYELKKLGHEVIVVSLYNKETVITQRLKEASVDVRFLDKKDGFDFSMFKKLKKLFKQEKPDVIHTHLYVTKYVFPVASKLKIKVVHTIHNEARKEATKFWRTFNKYYYKKSLVIPVALSKIIKQTIVEEYKINSEDVPIVFNGIDLTRCISKENYSIKERFKILHVGRFYEQKNHIGLVKAFKSFHEEHEDSELWLIGDGEKKDEIEKYVKANDLTSIVKFLGLKENIYSYLHDADIFTLPSNYEGLPMTLIEAMGTGLPIVATAVGGVPDMLDENSAQLVSVNEEEIAAAFEKYYLDYDLRKRHGENALKMSQRFSAETMAKLYCNIYR